MLESMTPSGSFATAVRQMPKTSNLPLIGSLPQLLRDPFGFVAQARQTHGDIYRLNLGLINVVVLNQPRHAQYVLRDNAANYSKSGPMWNAVRGMLGNGLVVSEGDFWLRQRRMMQPQFHRQRLAALQTLMVEAIAEALDSWEAAADGVTPFDLTPGFNRLTMKVIVRTLFGTGLTAQEMDDTAEAMTYALDFLMKAILVEPLPGWLPVPGRRKYQRALARFDEIVYGIIAQCRAGKLADDHLLAMLLDVVDEETGEGMTDQQLRDEVATLFLAGYETTSLALSWALHHLMQHPEMMGKMQAEVDGALDGRQPTLADLPQLPYTRMVLQEAMRLQPPSYWLPRTAVADDEIDGYHNPAGTQVVSLTYMYHRHPEHWENADEFDPERFTPERSANRHRYAWIPFGAGQRLCIGRDFAMMEGQLALAMVAQRFNITAVPDHEVKPMLSSTLRPKNGVMVTLEKRA